MKIVTFTITLLAIVSGIYLVSTSLFLIFVGPILGAFLISPLFVTLLMSKVLSGTRTQVILLFSTLLYFAWFVHVFRFHPTPGATLDLLRLACSLPVMIVLWFAAGALSLTRAEQISASNKR